MLRRLRGRAGEWIAKSTAACFACVAVAVVVAFVAGAIGVVVSGCGVAEESPTVSAVDTQSTSTTEVIDRTTTTADQWSAADYADETATALVRRAMTAIEAAFVDLRTYDPAIMEPSVLATIEWSVAFLPAAGEGAATAPTALASAKEVNYAGTATTYAVGTISATGTAFGVLVDHGAGTTTFYVDGVAGDWSRSPTTGDTAAADDAELVSVWPSGRRSHSMAWSPAIGSIVLFGGHDGENELLDTWFYDPADDRWTGIEPTGEGPQSSLGTSMVADPATGRLLVFGAFGFGGGNVFSGVWSYDPTDNVWARVPTEGDHPLDLSFCPAALDAGGTRAIVFGGGDETGRYLADTWAYELASGGWNRLDVAGNRPSARSGYSMVCDPGSGRLIMFGGSECDPEGVPLDSWAYDPNVNDTWAFDPDGNTWTELAPGGDLPGARSGHSMVHDPVSDRIILFGGMAKQSDGPFDDTWAYDPAANTWTRLQPAGEIPTARSGHAMVYDPAGRGIVLFGGMGFDDSCNWQWLDDTWVYDPAGNTWTRLSGSAAAWTPESTQDGWAKHTVEMVRECIEYRGEEAGSFDPAVMTPSFLSGTEPNIEFIPMPGESAALAPTADASIEAVNYWGTDTVYAIGARSTSGHTFGVIVDTRAGGDPTYYVDGVPRAW